MLFHKKHPNFSQTGQNRLSRSRLNKFDKVSRFICIAVIIESFGMSKVSNDLYDDVRCQLKPQQLSLQNMLYRSVHILKPGPTRTLIHCLSPSQYHAVGFGKP